MRKLGLIVIAIGVFLYFIFYVVEINSGKTIFTQALSEISHNNERRLGPIFLQNNINNYNALIKLVFRGVLSSDYEVKITDFQGTIIWSGCGTLKGESERSYGISSISLNPFKIKEAGNYYILFELSNNNKECFVKSIDISLKNNVIRFNLLTWNMPPILVVIGLIMCLIHTPKK